jgi:hypothetical protein
MESAADFSITEVGLQNVTLTLSDAVMIMLRIHILPL